MYSRLADVLEDEEATAESKKYYQLALSLAIDNGEKAYMLRGLLRQATDNTEADKLFEALKQTALANVFDWRTRGKWLAKRGRFVDSGAAYYAAANSGSGWYGDWCEGARNSYLGNDY